MMLNSNYNVIERGSISINLDLWDWHKMSQFLALNQCGWGRQRHIFASGISGHKVDLAI